MAQKQNDKETLLCTYKECRKRQTAEYGEFCKAHYPKQYRIEITMTEYGYVDVWASDKYRAKERAEEESNNGGFVGVNSDALIGKVTLK